MKEKVYQIEDAKVSCFFISAGPSAADEYEVDIVVGNLKYCIYTDVDPFENDEAICRRVYREWNYGLHKDVIAETI